MVWIIWLEYEFQLATDKQLESLHKLADSKVISIDVDLLNNTYVKYHNEFQYKFQTVNPKIKELILSRTAILN